MNIIMMMIIINLIFFTFLKKNSQIALTINLMFLYHLIIIIIWVGLSPIELSIFIIFLLSSFLTWNFIFFLINSFKRFFLSSKKKKSLTIQWTTSKWIFYILFISPKWNEISEWGFLSSFIYFCFFISFLSLSLCLAQKTF